MAIKTKYLKLMTQKQASFVQRQWRLHQHQDEFIDFDVSGFGDLVLKRFLIQNGVWHPFLSSGGRFARFLVNHSYLFLGKNVIELGSGTGLLGIVMALFGAKHVIMSDISVAAVENTHSNVSRFQAGSICDVRQGDLFANIPEKADLITWNIPFFPGNPSSEDTISASMIMPPELLRRFLQESRERLCADGRLVIPSHSLGGIQMDPLMLGESLGFQTKRLLDFESRVGIQKGRLYVTELKLRR